jgi:hypothetical protein
LQKNARSNVALIALHADPNIPYVQRVLIRAWRPTAREHRRHDITQAMRTTQETCINRGDTTVLQSQCNGVLPLISSPLLADVWQPSAPASQEESALHYSHVGVGYFCQRLCNKGTDHSGKPGRFTKRMQQQRFLKRNGT